MDTHISITAYGQTAPEALEAAEALLLERERLWSVTLEGSDIHAVNHADGEAVAVSAATADVLSLALEMAESTGGAYDPTIYPWCPSGGSRPANTASRRQTRSSGCWNWSITALFPSTGVRWR